VEVSPTCLGGNLAAAEISPRNMTIPRSSAVEKAIEMLGEAAIKQL